MEEENKKGLQENNLALEVGVNKNEETGGVNTGAEKACYESPSDTSDVLEYATMPGSWESYETETMKPANTENGVYPDDGRINSGSYFGMYNSSYGQAPWQKPYSEDSRKKRNKKNPVLFIIIGVLSVLLIVSAVVAGAHLFNRMLDETGGLPQSGQQSGGGSQQSGGQSGSGQSGGAQGEGSVHLQNGSLTLEQVPAGEHYKYSTVYLLTESTVVAIKSSVGSGSGVIISKDEKNNDGYFIVTNNHVIEGGTNIKVTLSNGAVYDAIVIGRDENTDLAVLKISGNDLKVATLGKSSELLVAEEILIIGNPLGTLGGSATNGIISAKNRTLSIDGYEMTLLQTNAAVNPGNSGGAMFNMSGQLVGIVNAKFTDEAVEGIGFAIPIDVAMPIIEDLMNWGFVKGRPNLGVEVTYGANRYFVTGWWVTEMTESSDAKVAGLNLNDLIEKLTVNGVEYSGNALNEFLNSHKLKTLKIGDEVIFYVFRYSINDYSTVSVTITEYGK